MTQYPGEAHPISPALGRLHRYTWWGLLLSGLGLSGLCLLTLLPNDAGTWQRLLLVAPVSAVTAQRALWLRQIIAGSERAEVAVPHQGAALAIATAAWAHAAVIGLPGPLWGVLPGTVLSGIVMLQPSSRRHLVAALGAGASAAATGWLLVLSGTPMAAARATALAGMGIMLAMVGLEGVQIWYWNLAIRLDEARRTAAAFAVVEERLRFSADLHDTQGHYLQVIALKGELMERLIDIDEQRARREASAIAGLARRAMHETRDLVRGYRQTSLQLEIDNAVGVLRAASVSATVEGDAGLVPHALQPLFGALVREGTTNVLRHAHATRCTVTVTVGETDVALRLANDLPEGHRPATAPASGSGLAGLRDRFAAVGGDILVEEHGDEFALTGRVAVDGGGRS